MGEDSWNARWAMDQPTMDMGQVTVTSETAMYFFSLFVSAPFPLSRQAGTHARVGEKCGVGHGV